MKLLILAPSFPDKDDKFYGGIFVKEQVKALSKYVDEINVITPIPRSFGKLYEDRVCKDYSFDNVNVYFPRFWHLPLNYFRKKRGEREAKIIDKLIQKKNIKFDLIHAHFTWPSGYAGVILKKKYKVPVVITVHENREWFLKEVNSGDWKIYYTWRSADALLRVNKIDLKILSKFNENVYYVPNGFDPLKFYPIEQSKIRKMLGLPENVKIIFSLGALIQRKGFQYLIKAMKIVVEHRNDVQCYIGGKGEYAKTLEKLIRDLKLEKNVKLIGFIPEDKLNLWMNACDLFVLPSLSESFGIVQIEAMACGKPVVATRNGGSEEIIVSEDYGLLCNPASSKDLAEKILIALEKKWDEKKILDYVEQFTWENVAKRIIDKYNIYCL